MVRASVGEDKEVLEVSGGLLPNNRSVLNATAICLKMVKMAHFRVLCIFYHSKNILNN